MADQLAPCGDIDMSTSKKCRIMCAENVADDARAAVDVELLPVDASPEESVDYIKKHIGAVNHCRRLELRHCYLVGLELLRLKKKLNLKSEKWDAYCGKVFKIGSRHARNYTALPRAFKSIEKMLKKVPSAASFPTAVDVAHSLLEPDPVPPKDDEDVDGEKLPKDELPDYTPTRDATAAELLDDILRIVVELGDDDLALLREVHGLLTKKTMAKGDTGSGKGRGKAKRRKAN